MGEPAALCPYWLLKEGPVTRQQQSKIVDVRHQGFCPRSCNRACGHLHQAAAEDVPQIRATAAVQLFQELGCEVFDAYNGREAVRMLEPHPTEALDDEQATPQQGPAGVEVSLVGPIARELVTRANAIGTSLPYLHKFAEVAS